VQRCKPLKKQAKNQGFQTFSKPHVADNKKSNFEVLSRKSAVLLRCVGIALALQPQNL
jgi:hypothetical protein